MESLSTLMETKRDDDMIRIHSLKVRFLRQINVKTTTLQMGLLEQIQTDRRIPIDTRLYHSMSMMLSILHYPGECVNKRF